MSSRSTNPRDNRRSPASRLRGAWRNYTDDCERARGDLEAAIKRATSSIDPAARSPEDFDEGFSQASVETWLRDIRGDVEAAIADAIEGLDWDLQRAARLFRDTLDRETGG